MTERHRDRNQHRNSPAIGLADNRTGDEPCHSVSRNGSND